jgi:hypothetical protein
LGGGRKGEEREVLLPGPGPDRLGQCLFDRVDSLGDVPGVLGLGGGQFLLLGGTEGQAEVLRRLPGLAGVGLVDDHGVAAVREVGPALQNHGELLEGGDDDAGLLPGQGVGQLLGVLVDLLDHPVGVLELVDGVL